MRLASSHHPIILNKAILLLRRGLLIVIRVLSQRLLSHICSITARSQCVRPFLEYSSGSYLKKTTRTVPIGDNKRLDNTRPSGVVGGISINLILLPEVSSSSHHYIYQINHFTKKLLTIFIRSY